MATGRRLGAPASADQGKRLVLLGLLTLYVQGLWGQAARLLPAPLDDWYAIPYRLLAPWWHDIAPAGLDVGGQAALFQLLAGWLLALLLPLLLLGRLGIPPHQAGLAWPRRHGVPLTAGSVLATLPLGWWLATATADPWGSSWQETMEYLLLVPEHFLLFAVFGVLLLPGRHLAWPTGQAGVAVFAVLAMTLNFGLLHVGTPHELELLTAFPLGLVFALMTVLSGSLWPALIAHVTLTLLPWALLSLPA